MALSDITPFDKRPLEQKLQSLGYTLYDDGENAPHWVSPDGTRLRFDENGDPILNGGEMQLLQNYNAELAAQGYAKNDYIQNNGGLTQDQAMQVIYGPGSVRVDEPRFGSLIKAGLPADQWNLPNMEGFGNGFLDSFADSGGPIKLLAGGLTAGLASALAPALTSVGANAAIGAGMSALTGGDPLAGLVSGGLGAALPSVGITDPALAGAIKGAAGSVVAGGDPLMAAATGAAGGYANSLLSDLTRNAVTYSASNGTTGPDQLNVSVQPASGMLDYMDTLGSDPWGTTPETYNNIPRTGETNVSFFDDILGNEPSYNADADLMDYSNAAVQDWAMQYGALNPDGTVNWNAIDAQIADPASPIYLGSTEGAPVVPDSAFDPTGLLKTGGAALVKALLGGGSTSDQLRRLFGGTQAGQGTGILSDIFGSRGLVGTGVALAPTLAAINYARNTEPINTADLQALGSSIPANFAFDTTGLRDVAGSVPTSFSVDTSALKGLQSQVPTSYSFDTSKLNDVYSRIPSNQTFDTSRLTAAYDAFDPNSVTGQYDLNTAAAREGLASSLSQRGITGSSFANSDFANFNQARDVGRQSLINDAITRRAAIASDILSNDRATVGLNLQGLGLQGQIANNQLDQQRAAAALGLQGQGLQAQIGRDLIGAQQTANGQTLQGLGLRGQLAQGILDSDYRAGSLGLQAQGLKRGIFGDILGARIQQQKNKNDLYGRALLALSGGLRGAGQPLF